MAREGTLLSPSGARAVEGYASAVWPGCRHAVVSIPDPRGQDGLGCLGGEEVAVVMPEGTLEAAETVAERLRWTLAAVADPAAGERVNFTVSIGVVDWMPDRSLEAALERADKAMYAAKGGGRNRVVRG